MRTIKTEPLTATAFARFGDVLDATGDFRLINQGLCLRHHDRARIDIGDGSQAFLPMTQHPFLVIATEGPEAVPRAFLTNGAQGINLHRGTWHGVLTPLHDPGRFAVVDRIGTTPNLEEYRYPQHWTVIAG